MTTGILRLKLRFEHTYIYSGYKLSKLTFANKNLCFKYTYDMFNVESCFDASSHGTVQIIRAQVQKQSPKWWNSHTWAHITLIVQWNHDFKPINIQAKIVVIQHNKSHVTSISQVIQYTSELNIVITTWKVAEQSNLKLTLLLFQIHASTKVNFYQKH
jgi:hypothetical protein